MKPQVWYSSITFRDGSSIALEKDDIVVVVGPNNSGKSAFLRDVFNLTANTQSAGTTIAAASLEIEGDIADLINEQGPLRPFTATNGAQNCRGNQLNTSIRHATQMWNNRKNGLESLQVLFVEHLSAHVRLSAADPANQIRFSSETMTSPLHYLYKYADIEDKISGYFKSAFNLDMCVNRRDGSVISLHVGTRPGHPRMSMEYYDEIEALPPLNEQGDGMRSFAGVALHVFAFEKSIVTVDEPEAFLHPPQAFILGKMLAEQKPSEAQLFIATHSSDVLRGLLQVNPKKLKIIRLNRDGNINLPSLLNTDQLAILWSDSLLRHSNIFDGLFHRAVVVCESDSDCRFYSALSEYAEEICGSRMDALWTHGGGKGRIKVIVRALKAVDIPVFVISDIDLLKDEHPFRDIVETLRENWSDELKQNWMIVKRSIDQRKPDLPTADVVRMINDATAEVTAPVFPQEAVRKIKGILARTSPWELAKETGVAFVPRGEDRKRLEFLLDTLRTMGIFVVTAGELECWDKTVGGHGPAWVNDVLAKNIREAPELSAARDFVTEIVRRVVA
jgi:predicted ATPase